MEAGGRARGGLSEQGQEAITADPSPRGSRR